jgi:hypothetical protein
LRDEDVDQRRVLAVGGPQDPKELLRVDATALEQVAGVPKVGLDAFDLSGQGVLLPR